MLKIPKKVPEVGFYYHYKHDPTGSVNNYAYEVVGVGFHTEDDAREGEEHFLIIDHSTKQVFIRLHKSLVCLALMLVRLQCGWEM